MAEGLALAHLVAAGHADWTVSSAGTWGLDGSRASEFSLQLLAERGIDLSGHRSRPVTQELLDSANVVLVMTHDHKEAVLTEFPDHADRVYLLSEMAGESFDIEDPIGGPIEEYRKTFAQVDDLLTRGLPRVIELMSEKL
jgi:protein-tyrosine phosphatase